MSPAASSSHVVEGDPSSWKTSYVESATNIFNKDVPVCVKGESTEKIEDLTVRILLGLNKQKQSKASAGREVGGRKPHARETRARASYPADAFIFIISPHSSCLARLTPSCLYPPCFRSLHSLHVFAIFSRRLIFS